LGGGYSGYGIAGYEISYMLSGDINWNILFINSTLSDDIYLYTTNFNCDEIHFKIRARDSRETIVDMIKCMYQLL
jgi:hypothetical protein